MIDREKEFRKAFWVLKRWANSPSKLSYTTGYSAGNADKEPAKKIYEYILQLQKNEKINFEQKMNLLYSFLNAGTENSWPRSGRSFYFNLRAYLIRSKRDIENGIPVQTRRK